MLVLILIILTLLIFYLYLKWHYSYWQRAGLYQIEPNLLYGNLKELMERKIHSGVLFKRFYDIFKSKNLKHGGIYQLVARTYFPIHLDMIKNVLQVSFNHFMNHGLYYNEDIDPIAGNLFVLENEKWRKLRTKLTPTFTTGKIKMMMPIMVNCSKNLGHVLTTYAKNQEAVNIKEIISRYTFDIIGSAAFGLDCNCLQDENSEFRKFGCQIFQDNPTELPYFLSLSIPIWIYKIFNLKLMAKEHEEFITNLIKDTIDYREKNNIYRKDFMHMLLQLKNKGKVTDDGDFTKAEITDNADNHFLTFNEVAAQCHVFFIAGFETSSTLASFALLELADNPDIQEKLRKEIKTVLKKYDNKITYEAVMEMTYLESVVNETLRKHPPATSLSRYCNEDYLVPDTNITIEKGTRIVISILGLHRDPEYYPEPDIFDPERFNETNKDKIPNFAFCPFGDGPRICIGKRFGLLQTKIALVAIIKDFHVTLNSKTKFPVEYAVGAIITAVEGGLWLNVHQVA